MQSKIYLSGPITGTEDFMVRFAEAEEKLSAKGFNVVNPAKENAALPKDTTWKGYMGESLKLLCGCDAIYMMRNWTRSMGANVEYSVARQIGLVVFIEGEEEKMS